MLGSLHGNITKDISKSCVVNMSFDVSAWKLNLGIGVFPSFLLLSTSWCFLSNFRTEFWSDQTPDYTSPFLPHMLHGPPVSFFL